MGERSTVSAAERRASRARRWSAAVVNHGSHDELALCLESLAAQTHPPVSVRVYDTGRNPAALADLERRFPDVVFESGPNVGYAAAANRSITRLVDEPGVAPEFVLIANPDLELDADFGERLIGEMVGRPRVAIGGGKLLRPGRRLLDSAGIVYPRHRRPRDLGSEEPDRGQHDRSGPVEGVSGAAMMVRVEALAALSIGGQLFDEDFFAYHEDTDLCWRARRLGFECWYEPSAVAVHARGWRREARFRVPVEIRRHSFKNHYLQLVKNERVRDLLGNLPWLFAWEGLRLGFVVLRDPGLLPAYLEAARGMPSALRKRRLLTARAAKRPSAQVGMGAS